MVWEADGSDIKYKGTIDKELPVSVKVRYYLDGKSISAGDIAGKAGNVTIRFDYTINTEATSNGYVFKTPYTMATAGVKVSVEAAVKEAVIKQAVNMSVEDYEAAASAGQISEEIRNQIEETIKQQTTAKMASDEIKAQIEVLVKEKMSSEEVKSQISQLIEQTMASDEISQQIANGTEAKIQELINEAMESEEVQNKLAEAEEGAKAVIALKTSLDKYNAFYLGVLAYTSAVDQASDGANKLSKGASELSDGAAQLSDGASDLYEGASKLYDGMDTFDREGVRKLIASLDEAGVKDLFDRFSALADVSGRDSLIGGIADNMDGESRIIVKTGKIAANN